MFGIKPALARNERNFQDASRALFELITVVGAILHRDETYLRKTKEGNLRNL